MKYTVYAIYAPGTEGGAHPVYVGVTKKTCTERLFDHIAMARAGNAAPLYVWMRDILRLGLIPDISAIEHDLPRGKALLAEKKNINHFLGLNPNLLNVSSNQAKFKSARGVCPSCFRALPSAKQKAAAVKRQQRYRERKNKEETRHGR